MMAVSSRVSLHRPLRIPATGNYEVKGSLVGRELGKSQSHCKPKDSGSRSPSLSKRSSSEGNFRKASGLMKRVPSFSELHKMTRSSNALYRLKQLHRQESITQEEFDVRMADLEKEIRRLRCEFTMFKRKFWEKTENNSRIFKRITKYLAWVTGLNLLLLRVYAFIQRKCKQGVTKNLSWSLFLQLMRSSEGRTQLREYFDYVLRHQFSVLTVKICPDLISLFCLSRSNEVFRICGFIVVLCNDQFQLYKQHYYPKQDAPRLLSILANLGANLLFALTRWWIIAQGLPAAVRVEHRSMVYQSKRPSTRSSMRPHTARYKTL